MVTVIIVIHLVFFFFSRHDSEQCHHIQIKAWFSRLNYQLKFEADSTATINKLCADFSRKKLWKNKVTCWKVKCFIRRAIKVFRSVEKQNSLTCYSLNCKQNLNESIQQQEDRRGNLHSFNFHKKIAFVILKWFYNNVIYSSPSRLLWA